MAFLFICGLVVMAARDDHTPQLIKSPTLVFCSTAHMDVHHRRTTRLFAATSAAWSTLLAFLVLSCVCSPINCATIPDEDSGFVDVRHGAHMFWWLYGCSDRDARDQKPLVVWLQVRKKNKNKRL